MGSPSDAPGFRALRNGFDEQIRIAGSSVGNVFFACSLVHNRLLGGDVQDFRYPFTERLRNQHEIKSLCANGCHVCAPATLLSCFQSGHISARELAWAVRVFAHVGLLFVAHKVG